MFLSCSPGVAAPGPAAPRGRGALSAVRPRRQRRRGPAGPAAPRPAPPPPWRGGGRARGAEGAAAVLLPRPRDSATRTGPAALTPAAARAAAGHLPAGGLPSRPGAGRGAPPRRKCARRGPRRGRAAVPGATAPPDPPAPAKGGTEGRRTRGSDGARAGRPAPAGLNPPGRLRGPHPFTS